MVVWKIGARYKVKGNKGSSTKGLQRVGVERNKKVTPLRYFCTRATFWFTFYFPIFHALKPVNQLVCKYNNLRKNSRKKRPYANQPRLENHQNNPRKGKHLTPAKIVGTTMGQKGWPIPWMAQQCFKPGRATKKGWVLFPMEKNPALDLKTISG